MPGRLLRHVERPGSYFHLFVLGGIIMNKRNAFTLIELLVVISIIVVFMAILMPPHPEAVSTLPLPSSRKGLAV